MKLNKYTLNEEGDKITISKIELERQKKIHIELFERFPRFNFKRHYHAGVIDTIGAILKCFEEEEQ